MKPLLSLAILLLVACGGGTDGKPVLPPTTPAPEPPPEPPGQPTGIEVVERGQDFIVWTWEPVEDATGYEGHAFPEGTPREDRPPILAWVEPTFRAEGLVPGTLMAFYVRAVRETASGRAVGPWSDKNLGITNPEPHVCTDEREASLSDHYYPPVLVERWAGEPFRIAIHPDVYLASLALGADWYEDQLAGPVNRMAQRIEDQLGYPVLAQIGEPGAEPAVRIELWDGQFDRSRLRVYCEDYPDFRTGMNARPQDSLVVYHEGYFDPGNQCKSALRGRRIDNVIHEIVHLLGGEHYGADTTDNSLDGRQTGWEMSYALTWFQPPDSDIHLTELDIARIGCVFPEVAR